MIAEIFYFLNVTSYCKNFTDTIKALLIKNFGKMFIGNFSYLLS